MYEGKKEFRLSMREIEKLEGFESFNEIPMASCLNKTDLESQEKLQDKKQKMKA